MSTINVEVVYPLRSEQKLVRLSLEEGASLRQAVERSGLLEQYPEINIDGGNKTGIWGKLAKLDAPLRDHDRVEIYRPLIADPKEVRKQRAAEGKVMKKGGGDAAAE
jgi:uncharacterized protein